ARRRSPPSPPAEAAAGGVGGGTTAVGAGGGAPTTRTVPPPAPPGPRPSTAANPATGATSTATATASAATRDTTDPPRRGMHGGSTASLTRGPDRTGRFHEACPGARRRLYDDPARGGGTRWWTTPTQHDAPAAELAAGAFAWCREPAR